jgi:hypothetical protein
VSGTTSNLHRYLGGSPLGVLLKLIVLSLIVGAIMAGLGLTPGNLMRQAVDAVHAVFGLGFDTLRNVGGYVVTGAVIVIPIWVITRIASRR